MIGLKSSTGVTDLFSSPWQSSLNPLSSDRLNFTFTLIEKQKANFLVMVIHVFSPDKFK